MRSLFLRPQLMEEADDGKGGTPPALPTPPAEPPATPPAGVQVDATEWNRIQAENRRMRKEAKERKDADEARKAKEAADAAKAAGDFDKAIGIEREQNDKLREQLRQTKVAEAIGAAAASRGLSAEQVTAAKNLASIDGVQTDDLGEPNPDQVNAALDAAVGQYPNLFKAETPTEPTRQPRRGASPATPVVDASKPEGFISMEEYAALPMDVRRSPEIQKRLAMSRPYYGGNTIPANSFAQANE